MVMSCHHLEMKLRVRRRNWGSTWMSNTMTLLIHYLKRVLIFVCQWMLVVVAMFIVLVVEWREIGFIWIFVEMEIDVEVMLPRRS